MKIASREATEKILPQRTQRGAGRMPALPFCGLAVLLSLFGAIAFAEPQQTSVNVKQLDQTIEKVIQERQYQWRLPRERVHDNAPKGLLEKFVDGMLGTIKKWMNPVRDWLRKVLDWIQERIFRSKRDPAEGDKSIFGDQTALLWILSGLIVLIIGLMVWKIWKHRRSRSEMVQAETVASVPDLDDDSTVADQYPEEGWHAMARDLLARGELRLAVRAMYMATLANLARKEMITIAKFKSNRDYQMELRRRAHQYGGLLDAFGENVILFERVWYGKHEANQAVLDRFTSNQNLMREEI